MAESKDSIMKMLLSTPSPTKADIQTALKVNMSNKAEDTEAGTSKLSIYLHKLNGQEEKVNTYLVDHSYCKPYNCRPDNSYVKPAKTLFVTKPVPDSKIDSDEIIDVEIENEVFKPAYNETKARDAMNDIDKHIYLVRKDAGDENWELKIDRTGWSVAQMRLFDRTVKILQCDRLARLTYQGSWNEPALRRIAINKSARRFRTLLSTFAWQTKLIQWLHSTLIEIMDTPYLSSYIDILQTLKKKVPGLVDRMLSNANPGGKTNPEALKALLKKPWDPTSMGLTCHLPQKKLPGNPIFVFVPNAAAAYNVHSPKIQRWYNHFSLIGTVVVVPTNNLNNTKSTVLTSLEHMMASTRVKISEIKTEYPGKNIVLVGFNSGAALACQVALIEPVLAVVCLGFAINTVDEKRGQPDDSLLNINVPVLFVVGQHAATSQVEDVEDLRERLRVENGLVIVGAADDCLRINKSKQSAEGITQIMLDRCIVDEIADFIGTLLLAPIRARQDVARSRIKVVEKKKKGPEDMMIRKNPTPMSQIQGVTYNNSINTLAPKKGKTMVVKGVGRQTMAAVTKKPIIHKEQQLGRQTMEKITFSGGIKRLSSDAGVDQYKILPQLKFIDKDVSDILAAENLIDQLTPDRLLEMPVIIQDDQLGDIKVFRSEDETGGHSYHSQLKRSMILKGSDSSARHSNEGVIIIQAPKSKMHSNIIYKQK